MDWYIYGQRTLIIKIKKSVVCRKEYVSVHFSTLYMSSQMEIKTLLLFNCLVDILMKLSGTVVRASNCLPIDREHDSWPSKVHSAFHPYRINKMSIRLAWELNTGGLVLGWPSNRYTCCIASLGPGSRKQVPPDPSWIVQPQNLIYF